MKSRHVTVLGGYTTGKESLEGVVEAAIDLGVASDGGVFTMRQWTKDPLAVRNAIREGVTITHSFGIAGVDKDVLPPTLFACNGPEQRIGEAKLGRISLGRAALTKMRSNRALARDVQYEFGPEYKFIGRDNRRQFMRHPWMHLAHISAVQTFSTSTELGRISQAGREDGLQVAAGVTMTDEFWPHLTQRDYGDVEVFVHEGNHDTLLANPYAVLGEWAAKTFPQNNPQ